MKVFLAGTSLRPAYGGPAYSVSRLAIALSEQGVLVGLWTPDQSVDTTALLEADSAVQRLTGTAVQALEIFGRPDVLHDNGLWRSHNHRLAALARARSIPRLVSTRGMLEPWAINHKRWRKRLAWMTYQRRDLKTAHGLHATADAEAANLARFDLGVPVHVIPNGVDLPDLDPKGTQSGATRTALFLGRLYPVKGLPMLIEAWSSVRPEGWRLRIAGPDEGGHRRELERQVSAERLQDVVSFSGPLAGDAKRLAMLGADLFALPTHSESFGMALGEALAHGVPVLTTTAAPWPMLEEDGFGWRVAPTVDAIAEGLRVATSLDPDVLSRMGMKGRAFVEAGFDWRGVAGRFMTLYESCAAHA